MASQKEHQNLVSNTDYRLVQVESIAECSPWSILQYFPRSLRYHLSLKPLFCLFLIGRLRQVLLHLETYSHMDPDVRKPVFRVSDHVRFKPACSATETRWNSEIFVSKLSYSILKRVNNKGAVQTVHMYRLVCAFVVHIQQTGFLMWLRLIRASSLGNLFSGVSAFVIRISQSIIIICRLATGEITIF